MKTMTARLLQVLTIVGTVAVLALSSQPQVHAQATVIKGEMTLNGELPFYTMPDDPFVDVFVESVCEVRFISDGSGGLHILVKEVKETPSATVVGTNFDYEFVSHEGFSPNNISSNGHFAGTIHEKIVLVRLDPATSLPIALVTGEGLSHVTVNSDGEMIALVEKIQWTITPF